MKKPVTLITGNLGSGKTTLLNEILRQEERRVALTDEYGISSFAYEYKKPFVQAGRNSSVMAVAYWGVALDEKPQKECLEGDEELRKSWDPEYGDRINQIVFIGKNYNKAKIVSRLEQCLA